MTTLECTVSNCAHNEDHCCKLSEIQVKGKDAHMNSDTSCGSFEVKSAHTSMKSGGCGCTAREKRVGCEAVSCMYNKGKTCDANHIDILGGHADRMNETECGKFTCN